MSLSAAPAIFAWISACTSCVGSLLFTAAASALVATKPSSLFSPSSMTLFSTPASLACVIIVFNTASSLPLMASSSSCVTSRCRLPAADTLRAAFSALASLPGVGLFWVKLSLSFFTSSAMSSGRVVSEPPRYARTSARPMRWKPIQSRMRLLSDLSHVGTLQSTTHKRFARVSATFSRRQSDVKPTSPLLLARTRLNMITSRSLPWNASTVETCVAILADCGSVRRISETCAPYGEITPMSEGPMPPFMSMLTTHSAHSASS
mmetsp:Transcript_54287/g.150617  ORF Transcript_54287/g.150617 Transcript_54287/m.150617 type:complete len:263 (-) Transcript_54287:609-1397(-)